MTNPIESLIAEAEKHCWQPTGVATDKYNLSALLHSSDMMHFKLKDTPSTDIVATLLEVVRVAVPILENMSNFTVDPYNRCQEALARINAMVEGK